MRVTIHQPTFFPYSGVIEKARMSDIFIVLARAQFTRGKYCNRFNLGGRWYTMSTSQSLEPLIDKRYGRHVEDWAAIKRKLPSFAGVLDDFDDCIGPSLVETNTAIIRRLFASLNIGARIEMDYPTPLTATARLVDLCQHYGATTYLSGPSGRKYLDTELFDAAGIAVEFQEATERPMAAIELLTTSSGGIQWCGL